MTPIPVAAALLSTLVATPSPWLKLEANSDQRQPVYLGLSPFELGRGGASARGAAARAIPVPARLRDEGEAQLAALARKLGQSDFEVEAWPAQDDLGRLTWALARWRATPAAPWTWLDSEGDALSTLASSVVPPFLPQAYRPWRGRDRHQVFDDFLLFDDLYAKPVFGDCVWTTEDGGGAFAAWMAPEERESYRAQALRATTPGTRQVCRVIPQPARLFGAPLSLVLEVRGGRVEWPASVEWRGDPETLPALRSALPPAPAWPADFDAAYERDVRMLSGDQEAEFPVSGRRERFTRKESADPSNQILDLVSFLEERYARLGIRTHRQTFVWRGIPQSNLIAVIPGSAPAALNHPVLMADHIDTAFCEDSFAHGHVRVSAPGADDNDTATAALLRAAEVLKDSRPYHDIWLVHLTGEEFPGDDLGARHLVSELNARGQEITGLVLMDMIGWHRRHDGLFQISAGNSEPSLKIARLALESSLRTVPHGMIPVVRTRYDERSYLYNTDGLTFNDSGLPVILLNEHVNYFENLDRHGYHQTSDTIALVDVAFAASIARVAIQTAAILAGAAPGAASR